MALADRLADIEMLGKSYTALINYISSWRLALKDTDESLKDKEEIYVQLFTRRLKPTKLKNYARNGAKKTLEEIFSYVISFASEMNKKFEEGKTYYEDDDEEEDADDSSSDEDGARKKKRKAVSHSNTPAVKVRRETDGDNNGARKKPNRDNQSKGPRCEGCHLNGHLLKDCKNKEVECFLCRQKGHRQAQCPQRQSKDAGFINPAEVRKFDPAQARCRYCAEMGHLIKNCPVYEKAKAVFGSTAPAGKAKSDDKIAKSQ
jgi:hypothetical protein